MRFKGIVQEGKKQGQKLGFPTVNIKMEGAPVTGIFAGYIFFDGNMYPVAAYADPDRLLLEAHILDYSGDLYGKEIQLELVTKIRDIEKFSDEASLKVAIAADIAKIRNYFSAP